MGTPFNPAWFRNIFDPRYNQMGQQGGFAPPPDIYSAAPVPSHTTPMAPPEPPDPQPFFALGDWSPPAPTDIPVQKPKPPYPISSPQSKQTIKPIKPIKSVPNLYPELIEDEPVPGLRRGAGSSDPYGPTVRITQEDLKNPPPYPDWYNRPSLDIDAYKNQTPDISSRAQANAPQNFMGQPYVGDEETEEETINRAMSGYKPNTQWNDRLIALLDSMPQRDANMSKWRKFGSFLVGAGLGPEAQEKATYAPYYRSLADWKLRLDPTMKGADLERQENVNLRQLAYQAEQARVAQQKADATTKDANTRAQRVEDQAEAARAKVEIDRLRAMGGEPIDDSKTGTVWMIYKDGSKKDTGIASRLVSPAQRQEWEIAKIKEGGRQRRLSAIAASKLGRPQDIQLIQVFDPKANAYKFAAFNKATKRITPVRDSPTNPEEYEIDEEALAAEEAGQPPTAPTGPQAPNFNPATGGTPPGAKPITLQSGKPVVEEMEPEEEDTGDVYAKPAENETQQIAGRKLRANQIKSNFREYRPWIQIDRNTGMPYVTEPGRFWGGPSEEDFRIINDMLDGRIPINPNRVNRPPGATKKGQYITLPSGKKVWQEP